LHVIKGIKFSVVLRNTVEITIILLAISVIIILGHTDVVRLVYSLLFDHYIISEPNLRRTT